MDPSSEIILDTPYFRIYSDRRIDRLMGTETVPAGFDPSTGVTSKDVVIDSDAGLYVRLYLPLPDTVAAAASPPPNVNDSKTKLPVLVYFHGGGFIVGSFASPEFHAACARLAAALPAVVLSADYRLAPEHRLPAALEDADTLFSWLGGQQADPWLADAADLGRVFVSGDSAGANIAHHAAAAPGRRLAGCVLLWPFFGGERRTRSEAACPGDAFLTLPLYDQMWRLALPAGATRDHPAANPEAGELPPLLVAAGDRDMLIDRIREYVARARVAATAGNRRVDLVEFPGAGHGFAILEPDGEDAGELVRVVRRFVHGGDAAGPPPLSGRG